MCSHRKLQIVLQMFNTYLVTERREIAILNTIRSANDGLTIGVSLDIFKSNGYHLNLIRSSSDVCVWKEETSNYTRIGVHFEYHKPVNHNE